jgi:hypothetical protein
MNLKKVKNCAGIDRRRLPQDEPLISNTFDRNWNHLAPAKIKV